jgi:hypothetical protein
VVALDLAEVTDRNFGRFAQGFEGHLLLAAASTDQRTHFGVPLQISFAQRRRCHAVSP